MSAKFYTLMTDIGAAKLASAAALGIPLKITQMAVGDGGGALPTPDAKQTALVAEKRRAALNMLYIDPQNSSQIIAEQVIPETEGGWWIREVGLFDETGALIAVGNCPESYKPQLVEGSGRTQTVRMVLITSSTDNITLKIDPSVVLATRSYVDNLIETRQQKSDTLTALAELKPAKGKFPYFTAEKAAALADLSDFIRLMLGKTDAAGALEYLGLDDKKLSGRLIKTTVIENTQIFSAQTATKYVRVRLIAGGASSGAVSATGPSQNSVTCPGGVGVYAEALFFSGFDGVMVTIGEGGQPRLGNGFDGGDSSFGELLKCQGGIGSIVGNPITPPGYTSPQGVTSAPTIDSSGILLGSEYGQPVNPAIIVSLGVATNYHQVYRSKLGNAGVGGSGQLRSVNASQVQGVAGTKGVCIVEEYS